MANNRIQPQFLRLDGKAIAHVTGSGIELASNDQRQKALEGTIGHSDGIPDCDFEVKTIITLTDGDDEAIVEIILGKRYCEMQATFAGRVFVVTCRCVTFSGSSEAESGKYEGTYKFESSGDIQLV
jgi:hypothetical protein